MVLVGIRLARLLSGLLLPLLRPLPRAPVHETSGTLQVGPRAESLQCLPGLLLRVLCLQYFQGVLLEW